MLDAQVAYHPRFPLNQIVDTIWVAKADAFELSVSHHAALFVELIFNYGEQFQVEGENVENFVSTADHHIISGLKTTPFRTTISGKYRNAGFILKPHYYSVLKNRFAGKRMQLLAEMVFEELIEPETPRFEKMEWALTSFLGFVEVDADLIRFERHISTELMRNGSLGDFSKTMATSQKSFIERFKKFYTLTPGEFVRLKQINYATQLIQRNPGASLTQIGLEAGFYDQSHFIRVFKRHHGRTPKQYQKNQLLS